MKKARKKMAAKKVAKKVRAKPRRKGDALGGKFGDGYVLCAVRPIDGSTRLINVKRSTCTRASRSFW